MVTREEQARQNCTLGKHCFRNDPEAEHCTCGFKGPMSGKTSLTSNRDEQVTNRNLGYASNMPKHPIKGESGGASGGQVGATQEHPKHEEYVSGTEWDNTGNPDRMD